MTHFPDFLILDAARMEDNLETAIQLNQDYDSLYRGREEEDLAEVAPYLFSFNADTDFSTWIRNCGWGNSWGIFVGSKANFEELYQHFQKLLIVTNEDGHELYFRFYDPRVLRVFLPTCDLEQLIEFFGPADSFFMEDENPEYGLLFYLQYGELITERMKVDEIFQSKILIQPA